MKISVVVATYCRSWALRWCLESLRQQPRPVDEVVVVLKSCGDDSEKVVGEFKRSLPIKLILQSYRGNCADAYELGYRNASGDIILFIDDDAIADRDWALRYEGFFRDHPEAGAVGGAVFKAYMSESGVIKTDEPSYEVRATVVGLHRKPLRGLEDYCEWISSAGFMGSRGCSELSLSLGLAGVNMGFRAELTREFPLTMLFGNSRKCYWFETALAYHVFSRGYRVYTMSEATTAPVVWHLTHERSLTRDKSFWGEFWRHYDRVTMFWRLRRLGVPVSLPRYALGLLVLMRIRTLPRLFATAYALLQNILLGED